MRQSEIVRELMVRLEQPNHAVHIRLPHVPCSHAYYTVISSIFQTTVERWDVVNDLPVTQMGNLGVVGISRNSDGEICVTRPELDMSISVLCPSYVADDIATFEVCIDDDYELDEQQYGISNIIDNHGVYTTDDLICAAEVITECRRLMSAVDNIRSFHHEQFNKPFTVGVARLLDASGLMFVEYYTTGYTCYGYSDSLLN